MYSHSTLFLYGALFSALVIALRVVWVFPGAYIAYWTRTRGIRSLKCPSAQAIWSWAGLHAGSSRSPPRSHCPRPWPTQPVSPANPIAFLAFCVILVTLVLQGLTLPGVVRILGIADTPGSNLEEENARREGTRGRARLPGTNPARKTGMNLDAIYEDLTAHYRHRLSDVSGKDDSENGVSPNTTKLTRISANCFVWNGRARSARATKAVSTTRPRGGWSMNSTCARPAPVTSEALPYCPVRKFVELLILSSRPVRSEASAVESLP